MKSYSLIIIEGYKTLCTIIITVLIVLGALVGIDLKIHMEPFWLPENDKPKIQYDNYTNITQNGTTNYSRIFRINRI